MEKELIQHTEIKAYFKSKGKDAINKLKTEFPDKVRQVLSKIVKENQIKTATTTSAQNYSKMGSVTEKAAPKLESLISKIMNETLSKKSAI
jgi:hypothetical protein